MVDRPNLVLVCTDQQRMDALGCYGNRFVESPHVDRLASLGTRFTHAFTPWPVCTPARGTMWTGLYPHAHQLIDNVYGVDNAFESASHVKTTVFDLLREAGYLTAHFGKWHLGEAQPPFFDVWEECFNSRKGHWMDGLQDGEYRPDRQTDACIAFLQRQKNAAKPFVMVQGYYPPHDPYTAPSRHFAPYRHKGIPFAGYYAAVSALDECTGRILATLDQTGLAARTIVIYYTDHGDTFFYRREGEHKFVCFDDAIRIPFIVTGPGVVAGATRSEPVGLQDLMPTLLDYAGIAAPAGLHGHSVRPLAEGRSMPWREDFYVQNVTHVSAIVQRCVRHGSWKLIASANGAHQFFDLANDPEEELDIFLTPRPDPGFERYKHVRDHAPEISRLAGRMRQTAIQLDDPVGVELADQVLHALAPRLAARPVSS
ncbi:MAG: sulfatase-like hydrolase/transferase [Rhodoferax sp.]|nr:sulfatase-like hydrolase/transferase [Rhodoferax sp.]